MRPLRRMAACGLLLGLGATAAEAGRIEDLAAVIRRTAASLARAPSFQDLERDEGRASAFRAALTATLTWGAPGASLAAKVVEQASFEPDGTADAYAARLLGTALRLGPEYQEALASGTRAAKHAFGSLADAPWDGQGGPLLSPLVDAGPAPVAKEVLADETSLDVLARLIHEGLRHR